MGAIDSSTKSNPKGSFEDRDFQKLNKEILYRVSKQTYWDLPSPREIREQEPATTSAIQELVDKKSRGKSIWGWKDGRTVLTIELFLPYLRNPYFVTICRNPLGTAKSIVAYQKGPVKLVSALNLVHFYTGEILSFLERHPELPNIFISFEDLIAGPKKETERLTQFLSLNMTADKLERIEGFLVPRKRIEYTKNNNPARLINSLTRWFRPS